MSASQLPSLAGRVALVTGGASGLGAATVSRFVNQGAKVVFCDLKHRADKGQALEAELGSDYATFFEGDVTSVEDVTKMLDVAKSKYGKLDINVNCAGLGVSILTYNPKKDIPEARYHSLELFQKLVRTNLIGTFNVIRLSAFAMKDNPLDSSGERGCIINTSAISAHEGQRGQCAYSASTGGVNSMTLPISRDLESYRIRCNTIAPGYFDTPILGNIPKKVRTFLESTVPNPPRLGKPDEFAHLAQSIVENPMINGETIRIDGALRLHP